MSAQPTTSSTRRRAQRDMVRHAGRFAVLLALAGLAACNHPKAAEPIAAAPPAVVEPPPEPPPVPEHKPRPPVPPPAPIREVARLEPPPPPSEPPPPPAEPPPAPEVIGLEPVALQHTLGAPAARRDSPPAVIWQYVAGDCTVDVYFVRDVQSGAAQVLTVDVMGNDKSEQRLRSCLSRIAGHAGTPGPAAADPPVAR